MSPLSLSLSDVTVFCGVWRKLITVFILYCCRVLISSLIFLLFYHYLLFVSTFNHPPFLLPFLLNLLFIISYLLFVCTFNQPPFLLPFLPNLLFLLSTPSASLTPPFSQDYQITHIIRAEATLLTHWLTHEREELFSSSSFPSLLLPLLDAV